MPESGCVVVDEGAVRIIRLDRPHVLNALDLQLWDKISDEVRAAGTAADIRVVIITGTGDRAFCSGVDLKEIEELANQGTAFEPPMSRCRRTPFEEILESAKPVICLLNGSAIGGGLELALACDIRICVEGALLGLPEAKIGMGASFGCLMLPRLVTRGSACRMLFTGEPVDASEALRIGLVDEVVPRNQLLDVGYSLARAIVSCSPVAIESMKARLTKGADLPLAYALRLDVGPDVYRSRDRQEATAARREGRLPSWPAI